MKENLYDILNIKHNSSEYEIKKAYHKLCKQYHPDKNNSSDACIKFQKIQSAYEILSNDKIKNLYQQMNNTEKINLLDLLEKIIENKININILNEYGIYLNKDDLNYLKDNFMNYIKSINVIDIINLFKGIIIKKNFNNINNSDSISDLENYDEFMADYFYYLPIYIQKINKLDIIIDIHININDILSNNKKKIKIKRKINDLLITATFIFTLLKPYIVYYNMGDVSDFEYGNLIIKLILPNNLYWSDDLILIEYSISLYEFLYGLNTNTINFINQNNIHYDNTILIPYIDGLLINISNNIGIKLNLNYNDTIEKKQIMKKYFS
jgi:curved DNA-binding protein CbpA